MRVRNLIVAAVAAVVLGLMAGPSTGWATHSDGPLADAATADAVVRKAEAHPDTRRIVRKTLAEHSRAGAKPTVEVRRSPNGENWALDYSVDGRVVLELAVDGGAYDLLFYEVAKAAGPPEEREVARAYRNATGPLAANVVMTVLLGCLFAALMLRTDRTPGRVLDVAALLALPAVRVTMQATSDLDVFVWAWIPMLWLLGRLLWTWLQPGGGLEAARPARWSVPTWVLVVLLVGLVVFRAGATLDRGLLSDVGAAGVRGAGAIRGGEKVYDTGSPLGGVGLDTYGPLNYLLYVPASTLEAAALEDPVRDRPGFLTAALTHLLADLAVVLLCLAWGTRLAGRRSGVLVALAWLSYPETSAALLLATNDVLVAALVALAMLTAAHPLERGIAVGLAAAVKLVPVIALPVLMAAGPGQRRRRAAYTLAGCALSLAAAFGAMLAWGDTLDAFYDSAIAFQLNRAAHLGGLAAGDFPTPWDWAGMRDALPVVRILAGVVLLAACVMRPATSTRAVAAGVAAAMLLPQVLAEHWTTPYTLWWLVPTLLVCLLPRAGHAPRRDA